MAVARRTNSHYFQSVKRKKRITHAFVAFLLLAGSVLILSPLWWMISTSLKSMTEVMHYPPTLYPMHVHWGNYVKALESFPFFKYAGNTLFITVFVVIGSVLSNTFVAYGFAKIQFRGKNIMFALVLTTMMIPGFVTMIPQYIIFTKLNWLNTYLPLIVPSFFGSAFFIFLLRQFFMGIPNDYIEAAKIDGANHFYIWWKIAIPMAKPAIATVAIFSFNGAWNDFLGPLLYVNKESLYTLQIGLSMFKDQISVQWNYLMAASLLVLVPVVLLFFIFQRYFIEGMDITGGRKM